MKPYWILILCPLLAVARPAAAAAPTLHRRTLPNGVEVCYLHAKGSTNFSMFTFLPMGLAWDDAGHAQWAHLIEHLVIRTTVPGPLTNVNAETLPDHMRLDYYGSEGNWREGVRHHARWLAGEPFTDESVRVEPARANAETEHAVRMLATHKFATAAWGQVCRHGADRAAVQGDIMAIGRAALQAYRDERLVIPAHITVCAIGGVDPTEFLAAAEEALAAAKGADSDASGAVAPVNARAAQALQPGERQATWDLEARHVMLTWPIPSPEKDPEAYAALMVLGRLLWMDMAQDRELQRSFGMVLTGTDLRSPEGSYFYVSAPVRPEAGGDVKALVDRVSHLLGTIKQLPPAGVRQVAAQLVAEMDVMDPAVLLAAAPAHLKPQMVEAQVAITWGTAEYRMGSRRAALGTALRAVTVAQLRRVVSEYLKAGRRTSLELRPDGR
ncbi:MAG TPA: insulinase family protein [Tepidisphaeraceae bacterium]|nr:insulinase family protein [Tepidisphaeraceae bacterium]